MQARLIGIVLTAAFFATAAVSRAQESHDLVSGLRLERALGSGENHVYSITLQEGAGVIGAADQHGIDLVIDIFGPDGKVIRTVDSPNGANGPEPIDVTAFKTGLYKLVIHTLNAKAEPGKYVMKIDRVLTIEENGQRLAEKNYPPALQSLWRASLTDPKAVESFVASRKGKGPIIEDLKDDSQYVKVTYLYYGDENTEGVRTGGGPHDGSGGIQLTRFMRTPLFFGSEIVPRDARYTYGFSVIQTQFVGPSGAIQIRDAISATDRLNPEMFGDNSTLTLPAAPAQPYLVKSDSVPEGKLTPISIKSLALKEDRTLTIYTPAGYDGTRACDLVIVFDGQDHTGISSIWRTPTTLNNLVATRKINPTIAVFVNNMGNRQRDLTGYAPLAEFIGKELVSWVRQNYRISPGASHVVVAGVSLGGLSASYCAFMHSDTIGNVLSQSGSYWITKNWQSAGRVAPLTEDTGDLVGEFRKSNRLPIKFYLEIGRFEGAGRMLGTNREFRDVLQLKGYPVIYNEVNGGHDEIWWRGSFADGLISLIGRNGD